ncbi:BCLAF1 and THRAP3 family member 3-like isoform X4 [Mobula hypostoma]|uniref:BCLAF1 and THRAP3 family member 3-like isoform X4 n=1 Tax=Mobula hypostoma TaxID=723540 RepID=UPI002FC38F35
METQSGARGSLLPGMMVRSRSRSPRWKHRYPEDNDVKGYREASGRGWVPGKLEAVDHEQDLKWRGEKMPHNKKPYTSALYNDSENARIKDVSRNWYSDSDRFEEFVQVKSGFAHSQKYPEMHSSSEHHHSFSSERQQRYSSKDKEYTTGSLSAKEVSRFHSSSRRSGTDANKEGHYSASSKYLVPEHYSDRFPRAGKKEVSPRYTATSATRGRVERRKEFGSRPKDQRDDTRTPKRSNHGSYHMEASHCVANNEKDHTTESLTIKLDMKKTVNKYRPASSHSSERLMSRDLVSVGKKRDEFHHVFEHMGSSLKANPNISSGEFAQEIITLVHQIKGQRSPTTGPQSMCYRSARKQYDLAMETSPGLPLIQRYWCVAMILYVHMGKICDVWLISKCYLKCYDAVDL